MRSMTWRRGMQAGGMQGVGGMSQEAASVSEVLASQVEKMMPMGRHWNQLQRGPMKFLSSVLIGLARVL